MGGTDEKLGKELKEQASGINGSRTSQTGFNINNAALLSKHSYHQQDTSFANQEASKHDCFKPANRDHKQHEASPLSLSNPLPAASASGFLLVYTARNTQHCAAQRLFLRTARQKSRAAATTLEPISTAKALLSSGHSEPSCSSAKHKSSPSLQQADTSAAGEYPLLPSCAARCTSRC